MRGPCRYGGDGDSEIRGGDSEVRGGDSQVRGDGAVCNEVSWYMRNIRMLVG